MKGNKHSFCEPTVAFRGATGYQLSGRKWCQTQPVQVNIFRLKFRTPFHTILTTVDKLFMN